MDIQTTNGALDFSRSDLVLASKRKTVAQALQTRLSTLLGTRPWDTSSGVDLLGKVFVKNPNLAVVSATLKAAIVDVVGVARLVSYSQTLTGRALSVTFQVETDGDPVETLQVSISTTDAARAQLTFVCHLV